MAIDDFSQRFREAQLSHGIKLGVTRVGVHGGPAIVGNFGGERFFDYTAMGDTVNTAARLEGANKYLGTRICVSEAVARATPQIFRPGGILVVKGRSAGIATFEPLKSGAPETIYLEAYLQAYAAMAANSPDALAAFEGLCAEHPDDRLVAFHRRRLAECQTGAQIVLEGK
jgi:adenylate cyclase